MAKLNLFTTGELRTKHFLVAFRDYLERTRTQVPLEHTALANSKSREVEQAKEEEAKKLIASLKSQDYLILMDETGKHFTSVELSELISQQLQRCPGRIIFAIGGPNGWHKIAKERANLLLSLSKMTLPHELAAVVLAEQIYRAQSILAGGPYHRG